VIRVQPLGAPSAVEIFGSVTGATGAPLGRVLRHWNGASVATRTVGA
jgi:hypothetical protein